MQDREPKGSRRAQRTQRNVYKVKSGKSDKQDMQYAKGKGAMKGPKGSRKATDWAGKTRRKPDKHDIKAVCVETGHKKDKQDSLSYNFMNNGMRK